MLKAQYKQSTQHTSPEIDEHKRRQAQKQQRERNITEYASRRRTQLIIRDAANNLRAIRTEHPTAQAVSQALCYSVYQAQLQRFRQASLS